MGKKIEDEVFREVRRQVTMNAICHSMAKEIGGGSNVSLGVRVSVAVCHEILKELVRRGMLTEGMNEHELVEEILFHGFESVMAG